MIERSPCIGICTATAFGDAICRGCKRTFEEVRDWNRLTPEQRAAVIERIKNPTNGLV